MGSTNRGRITEDLVVKRDVANTLEVEDGYEAVLYRNSVPSDRIYARGSHPLGRTKQRLRASHVPKREREMVVETNDGYFTLRYFIDIPFDVSLVLQFRVVDIDVVLANDQPKALLHDVAIDAVRYAQRLAQDTAPQITSLKNELSATLRKGIEGYFRSYTVFAGLWVTGVVVHETTLGADAQQSIDAVDKLNLEARALGVSPLVLRALKDSQFSLDSLTTLLSMPNRQKLAEMAIEAYTVRGGSAPQDLLDAVKEYFPATATVAPAGTPQAGLRPSHARDESTPRIESPAAPRVIATSAPGETSDTALALDSLAADLVTRGLTIKRSVDDPAHERLIVDARASDCRLRVDEGGRHVIVEVRRGDGTVLRDRERYEGVDGVYEQIQRALANLG